MAKDILGRAEDVGALGFWFDEAVAVGVLVSHLLPDRGAYFVLLVDGTQVVGVSSVVAVGVACLPLSSPRAKLVEEWATREQHREKEKYEAKQDEGPALPPSMAATAQ